MIAIIQDTKKAAPLFEGWQESMVWSCLQNVMGAVYGKEGKDLPSAKAVLGDFCFFAGETDRELIRHEMERKDGASLLVPRDGAWAGAILEEAQKRTKEDGSPAWSQRMRYALKKEPEAFCRKQLEQAAGSLKPPYEMRALDETAFLYSRINGWCRDWTAQFSDYGQYQSLGVGYVVYEGERVVSGASSYARYRDGIEIQIDTRHDHRHRGLAYACAARLILECLDRGWYPSWDAHNKASLALAEKLGYHFAGEYLVFERE